MRARRRGARKLRLEFAGAVDHVISRGKDWAGVPEKTDHNVQTEPKGVAWKVAVAAAMKQTTTGSNPWLAHHLHIGRPFRLSRLVSDCRRNPKAYEDYNQRIAKCKSLTP